MYLSHKLQHQAFLVRRLTNKMPHEKLVVDKSTAISGPNNKLLRYQIGRLVHEIRYWYTKSCKLRSVLRGTLTCQSWRKIHDVLACMGWDFQLSGQQGTAAARVVRLHRAMRPFPKRAICGSFLWMSKSAPANTLWHFCDRVLSIFTNHGFRVRTIWRALSQSSR